MTQNVVDTRNLAKVPDQISALRTALTEISEVRQQTVSLPIDNQKFPELKRKKICKESIM